MTAHGTIEGAVDLPATFELANPAATMTVSNKLSFQPGQRVKEGDLLMQIDPPLPVFLVGSERHPDTSARGNGKRSEKKKKINYSSAWAEARKIIWGARWRLLAGSLLMLVSRLAGMVLPAALIPGFTAD